MKQKSIPKLDFGKQNGLLPVIVQDYSTREVLMLAYTNAETLRLTIETGYAHFWSRSRQQIWKKGDTSGHVQRIREIRTDCDDDTIVYLVNQTGAACHEGDRSCFHYGLEEDKHSVRFAEECIAKIVAYFQNATVVRKPWRRGPPRQSYHFIINPLTENIPPPEPEVLAFLADAASGVCAEEIDRVVGIEVLGLPIATLVAERKAKPLSIIRKRKFNGDQHLLGSVSYASGYERGRYYVYNVKPGERIVLVDDTVSTGGALVPLLKLLHRRGVSVADVVCTMEKPEYGGVKVLKKQTGIEVKTLIRVFSDPLRAEPTSTLLNWLSKTQMRTA